ncbi:MAG: dihydrofolate reductase [Actinomycetes bacterium]
MTVGLIWAQGAGGVIGYRGALPWHLPEDLARFRMLTMGSTVVMGRRTWESLPARARPLPGRRNVVLTCRPDWHDDGALVARSVVQALAEAPGHVWVIGGASVYAAALPFADRVEVTELQQSFTGDVHAPPLGPGWREVDRAPADGWSESRTGLRYRTVGYLRE